MSYLHFYTKIKFIMNASSEVARCSIDTNNIADRKNGEWEYMQFHTGYNFVMLPTENKGVLELVVSVNLFLYRILLLKSMVEEWSIVLSKRY